MSQLSRKGLLKATVLSNSSRRNSSNNSIICIDEPTGSKSDPILITETMEEEVIDLTKEIENAHRNERNLRMEQLTTKEL